MPLEKWAPQAGFSHCERGWTGSGASKTEVGPLEAPPGRATWDRAGRGGTSIGPAGPPLDRAQILPLVGIGADHVPLQQQSATWATLTAAARSDEAPSCCSIVTRRQKCKVPRASANYITIRAPPRCQSNSSRSDRWLQQIVYMEKMKLGFDNRWLLPPPL